MAPTLLLDAGIRFLLVEGLSGSKIDGMCYWLNQHSPVVWHVYAIRSN